jgi:2-polyprenyl-3-methyl-5-hydroxy-6-metoxy-1,4-benzoquinol methylase
VTTTAVPALEMRARQSRGSSNQAIYRTVAAMFRARGAGGVLADVGCGRGLLWNELHHMFSRCIGIDAVRYPALPADVEFHHADFDAAPLPLCDAAVDAAVAVETVEHLENPWAFCRELYRIVRPGGWIILTTPNQLSALSLLTLIARQRFSAFQDCEYPAHRTALLEIDLRRIAAECGFTDVDIRHTESGRMPLTAAHYPAWLSRVFPRACSDNIVVMGRRRV